jgi:hypothetical protein
MARRGIRKILGGNNYAFLIADDEIANQLPRALVSPRN